MVIDSSGNLVLGSKHIKAHPAKMTPISSRAKSAMSLSVRMEKREVVNMRDEVSLAILFVDLIL
jgi:hypothetical protein